MKDPAYSGLNALAPGTVLDVLDRTGWTYEGGEREGWRMSEAESNIFLY